MMGDGGRARGGGRRQARSSHRSRAARRADKGPMRASLESLHSGGSTGSDAQAVSDAASAPSSPGVSPRDVAGLRKSMPDQVGRGQTRHGGRPRMRSDPTRTQRQSRQSPMAPPPAPTVRKRLSTPNSRKLTIPLKATRNNNPGWPGRISGMIPPARHNRRFWLGRHEQA